MAEDPDPADGDPAARSHLPRTGADVRHLTQMAGLLLIIGALATLAGARRRKASQA